MMKIKIFSDCSSRTLEKEVNSFLTEIGHDNSYHPKLSFSMANDIDGDVIYGAMVLYLEEKP